MDLYPITSLLEQDLYKFSMGQAVLHWFPKTNVKVEFKERDGVSLGYLKPQLDEALDYLCTLHFRTEELDYLRNIRWLSSDYIDYLERFYLKRDQIHTETDDNGRLVMWAEGPWRDVIYFEIPCLAIVSELYMRDQMANGNLTRADVRAKGDARLDEMIGKLKNCFNEGYSFTFADFGLRRRFSSNWQEHVVERFIKEAPEFFVGTSNVLLAKYFDVKPIGTFAHEWFMGIQGENVRLSEVQKTALDIWAKEYRGELGIALSDIFGFNAFLRDFDKYFAKLFDGCRHDSGSPFTWGEMLIEHYKALGLDPLTKTGCWSDSLSADKCVEIAKRFCGRIKVSFGVGTSITNSVGIKPLNMVMKMTESNGHPVCKLSDSPGKGMCHSENYVDYCKTVYAYKSIDEA